MKEIQTHLPTSGDDHGPNDVYSQVLGRKKSRSTSTYGLGSTRGGKNSRMSIVREALEAKKSAEEEVQRVQQEIGKLREGQTKILALIQKNNPDLNLDDVVASPIRVCIANYIILFQPNNVRYLASWELVILYTVQLFDFYK
ncbi:hypothetical protein LINPERPRIM_LOCUS3635 [Linum perenne]